MEALLHQKPQWQFSRTCTQVCTCNTYTCTHINYQNTIIKPSQHPFPAYPTSLSPSPGHHISKQTGSEHFQEPSSPWLHCKCLGALTSPWATSRTGLDEWPRVHNTDSLDSGSAVLDVLETGFLWVTKGDVSASDLLLATASTVTSFSSCSLSFFSFSFR